MLIMSPSTSLESILFCTQAKNSAKLCVCVCVFVCVCVCVCVCVRVHTQLTKQRYKCQLIYFLLFVYSTAVHSLTIVNQSNQMLIKCKVAVGIHYFYELICCYVFFTSIYMNQINNYVFDAL